MRGVILRVTCQVLNRELTKDNRSGVIPKKVGLPQFGLRIAEWKTKGCKDDTASRKDITLKVIKLLSH